MTARPARPADAPSITAIYNQGIEDRVATFENQPRTPEDIRTWFNGLVRLRHSRRARSLGDGQYVWPHRLLPRRAPRFLRDDRCCSNAVRFAAPVYALPTDSLKSLQQLTQDQIL